MNNNMAFSGLVKNYLKKFLDLHKNSNFIDLHKILSRELERALIETIMEFTQGNQINASRLLGLNRNTLRKKIKDYKIDIGLYKA